VTDLVTDYQVGAPEVQILPDRRRATDVGVSVADVANTIGALVGGNTVGKFSTEGRRIDMRVQLMAGQRKRPEDVRPLPPRAQNGSTVPLSLLVTEHETAVLQAISRVDRERAIGISGNVAAGHSQTEAMGKVAELAKSLPLGYRAVASGQASQLAETTSGLFF